MPGKLCATGGAHGAPWVLDRLLVHALNAPPGLAAAVGLRPRARIVGYPHNASIAVRGPTADCHTTHLATTDSRCGAVTRVALLFSHNGPSVSMVSAIRIS